MSVTGISQASPRNGRRGRPRDESIRDALVAIVRDAAPCTVRQAFYLATVRGLVPKTELGYDKVGRLLVELRMAGAVGWGEIADNTRRMRKALTYDSLSEAAERWAASYRRDLLQTRDHHLEVWLEKDALSGVISPITDRWDVPLMVTRGYASLSFLHAAAEEIAAWAEAGWQTTIYYLGDHDPSGRDIDRNVEARLREFAPDADLTFTRIAVREEQIVEWNLPTRPTKQTDARSKTFTGESVELDAIPPADLRALVDSFIRSHVNDEELAVLQAAERSEREGLRLWAASVRAAS